MSLKDEVHKQLETLGREAREASNSFRMVKGGMGSSTSNKPESELRQIYTRAMAAIERIGGKDSVYYQTVPAITAGTMLSQPGYQEAHLSAITGALDALAKDVREGMLESLETKLRANVHDDFLVQAEMLLSAGYHVAAMVLIGGVVEDHLQKLCTNRSLSWSGKGSLSAYNDLLHGDAYEKPVWRRIQGIGDVRNHAAHGEGGKVKREDVDDALAYAHRMLADYPS